MSDKVTDKYEKEGTAIYYMSLPAEEHAEKILDMSENDELVINDIEIDTFAESYDKSVELRKMLTVFSPQIRSVKFNITYSDELNLIVIVDYLQKIIILTVDPTIDQYQKKLLADFYMEIMNEQDIFIKEEEDDDYRRFAIRCGIILYVVGLGISVLFPFTCGTFLLFAAIASNDKIMSKIYDKFVKK